MVAILRSLRNAARQRAAAGVVRAGVDRLQAAVAVACLRQSCTTQVPSMRSVALGTRVRCRDAVSTGQRVSRRDAAFERQSRGGQRGKSHSTPAPWGARNVPTGRRRRRRRRRRRENATGGSTWRPSTTWRFAPTLSSDSCSDTDGERRTENAAAAAAEEDDDAAAAAEGAADAADAAEEDAEDDEEEDAARQDARPDSGVISARQTTRGRLRGQADRPSGRESSRVIGPGRPLLARPGRRPICCCPTRLGRRPGPDLQQRRLRPSGAVPHVHSGWPGPGGPAGPSGQGRPPRWTRQRYAHAR